MMRAVRFKNLGWPARIAVAGLVLCILAGFYGVFIEPFRLVVARWTVETPKWNMPGDVKIVILTDLHMKRPWMTPAHLQEIVEAANALQPDIVVLLGDYIATHPFGLSVPGAEGVKVLENLSPRCGVFAVLGNHDFNPVSDWEQALAQSNKIALLQNDAVSVACGGKRFWVAGLGELRVGEADIAKTLSKVRNRDPIIMLMHNPDSFAEMPAQVALSLAGHTHGGQVRFPLIGAVESVIPSKYGKRYLYGHIREGDRDLVVSSGLGMTGIPVRFLTPPEISFVTLRGFRA